ncbi:unnamed protein product, partial [Rangifer tarandus platyrhynchus]
RLEDPKRSKQKRDSGKRISLISRSSCLPFSRHHHFVILFKHLRQIAAQFLARAYIDNATPKYNPRRTENIHSCQN